MFGGPEESDDVNELLALLGQHWRLLLLYPGGLTALIALILVTLLIPYQARWRNIRQIAWPDTVLGALWLLVIALLPFPQTGWPYGLDLPTLLLLIELPYWSWHRHHGAQFTPRATMLLNIYPLLALAVAMVGQSAGSLVVREINRNTGLLHWVGIAAWCIALPPLLGLGPWRTLPTTGLVTPLRALTHVALVVAAALPANDTTPRSAALIAFGAALLPLAALHRWWRGRPERWISWQPWLVGGLTLLALVISAQQYWQRLG